MRICCRANIQRPLSGPARSIKSPRDKTMRSVTLATTIVKGKAYTWKIACSQPMFQIPTVLMMKKLVVKDVGMKTVLTMGKVKILDLAVRCAKRIERSPTATTE
jgi:hypothetical protein